MSRRWRLFPKYALLIITLVGGMLIASGAIGIYFSWRETQANLVALQVEKAQNAATRIEQYIRDIEHEISWTALPRVDADGDALEQRRIEYLKLQRQEPAITEVVWIDPQGREQLRISRLAMDAIGSGTDLSQDPKFRKVASGEVPVWYGPVYFRKGTEPYMTIARPAGSDGGVTAAEVNLKFVWDVVSRIKIGATGLAYVVDSTGTLIAHPDISLVLKKSDLSALPQVAALRGPADGAPLLARDSKGEEVLSAHAAIPTLRWTVFVESPRAEAFAPLYATLQRTSLVLIVALLISMAASFFLARALVRPLRALQEGAAKIGAGDLDRHIEVRTGDELEGLAEQFNHMSAQLRESYAGLERKVEQRTAELTEALEYQTATAEILKVISSSPDDLQPVLEAVAERSRILCRAEASRVWLLDDHPVRARQLRARTGYKLEDGSVAGLGEVLPLANTSVVGQAFIEARTVHVDDVAPLSASRYPASAAMRAQHGFHTVLAVPMLRDGDVVGVIAVLRAQVRPFSAAEVRLVETFADQALIAMENVRLFNETKEALQQQTATAEVLRVISGSIADSAPVFEKILESCNHLFSSTEQGILLIGDDNQFHLAAHRGIAREPLQTLFPAPVGPEFERAILERRSPHYKDVFNDPDVPAGIRAVAERIGVGNYSQVFAPMVWEGRALGTLYCDAAAADRVQRQGDRPAAHLRRPGRDRDPERAPLQRDEGGSRAADRDGRGAAGDQQLGRRHAAGVRQDPRQLPAALRCDRARHLSRGRRRHAEEGGLSQRPREARACPRRHVPAPARGHGDCAGDPRTPRHPLWRRHRRSGRAGTAAPDRRGGGKLLDRLRADALGGSRRRRDPGLARPAGAVQRQGADAAQDLRRPGGDRDPERTPLQRDRGQEPRARDGQQAQVGVPRQHVARAAHAAQRDHRLLRGAERADVRRRQRKAARVPARHPHLGAPSALAHQRHPRPVEDRGRPDGARSRDLEPADAARQRTTLVRERASRQGLVLALDVDGESPTGVADVRKLKQIVINLLSNAVKFTPAGGRVTLRARRLENAVEIAVVDTGVGIPEDQQALVFEEFRQAGGDYLRKSEGTGLGLALAKRFVELHGGTMRVESEPGQRLDLCLYSSRARRGGSMSTILIVEDNEKNMKLVRDILRHKGHDTLEAATGEEGVRLALEQVPKLILMDIQLPDIDGIEALRRIRANAALDATPVIAVSASVMPDDQQKIVTSGFDAFVTKPINLRQFQDTVQRFLASGRVR